MKLVRIQEKQVTRYKQPDNYVKAGMYLQFTGRPSDAEKKVYDLIAVEGQGIRFAWLAPAEPWVKRLKSGLMLTTPQLSEEPDWDLIGVRPEILRTWQKNLVREVWNYLRSGMRYGMGWIAKLGAGKTLAGLLVCQLFEPGKSAVLADKYLHSTWRDQAEEWGMTCPLLSTYESCHKLPEGIECLIGDEILRAKNPDAIRTQSMGVVSEACEVSIGFTGIPTGGKGPLDFRWLRVPSPGCVPASEKSWQFLFGLDTELKEVGPNKAYITTEWDEDKISNFISPFIRTADPEEINAELPELTYRTITCPRPADFDLVKSGGATCKGTHKRLAQVRQITDGFIYNDEDKPVRADNPKLRIVRQFVEDLGEPVILVTAWSEGVEILKEEFKDYIPSVVQGGTKDFAKEIQAFQNGLTSMMILNAGFSKGMNLQKVCRTICFLSLSTKPDDHEQMIGRVYRPGQKSAVQVVYFVCENSLDARTIELVQKHRDCSKEFIEKLLLEEMGF